jgi:hypothetical protein
VAGVRSSGEDSKAIAAVFAGKDGRLTDSEKGNKSFAMCAVEAWPGKKAGRNEARAAAGEERGFEKVDSKECSTVGVGESEKFCSGPGSGTGTVSLGDFVQGVDAPQRAQ